MDAGGTTGSIWGLIDAREGGDRRVAGLTLVERQKRIAARLGWAGTVVVRPGEEPPADDGRRWVRLDGRGLYLRDKLDAAVRAGATPRPELVVQSKADERQAQRIITDSLRKGIIEDGVAAFYLLRPISRVISRLLVNTPITPNQVTLIAMAFGVAASIAAAGLSVWLAGVLLWIGATIDCVDGELARMRMQGSKLGEWLDTLADDVSSFGVLFGVCYGLWRDGYPDYWLWIGAGGAVVGFATQVKLYLDLHRMGMTIDTAQYPWFLGKPAGGMAKGRGPIGWIVLACSMFFRRDAFVTMLAILFALNLRRFAVGMMIFGVVIVLGLLIIHELVTALRRRSPSSA